MDMRAALAAGKRTQRGNDYAVIGDADGDRVGRHAGQRDVHAELAGGLDDVHRRLPGVLVLRARYAKELAVQAIRLLQERERLAPHPA